MKQNTSGEGTAVSKINSITLRLSRRSIWLTALSLDTLTTIAVTVGPNAAHSASGVVDVSSNTSCSRAATTAVSCLHRFCGGASASSRMHCTCEGTHDLCSTATAQRRNIPPTSAPLRGDQAHPVHQHIHALCMCDTSPGAWLPTVCGVTRLQPRSMQLCA